LLSSALKTLPIFVVFAAVVIVSLAFLFLSSKSVLAPDEDQG